MGEYLPLEHFRVHDYDQSSYPVRDFPRGKSKLEARLLPNSVSFPATMIDTPSASYPVIVMNTGYEQLTVLGLSTTGPFSVRNARAFSLAPGDWRSIDVTFRPTHEGEVSGSLYVDTGDAAGEELVTLYGKGASEGTLVFREPEVLQVEPVVLAAVASQPDGGPIWASVTLPELPDPDEVTRVFLVVYAVRSNLTENVSFIVEGKGAFPVLGSNGSETLPPGTIRAKAQSVFEFTGTAFRLVA